MEAVAVRVIDAAVQSGLPLEKNCSSMRHKHHYWKEFWEIAEVNGVETVIGLDAHKLKRLELPDFQQRGNREFTDSKKIFQTK